PFRTCSRSMNLNCATRCSAGEPLSGSWKEFHEIFALWTLNLVGKARCAVRAALSGAMMPPRCFAGGDIAARCPYQSQVHGKSLQSRQSIPVSVTDSGPRVVSKEISHLPERAVENSV